MEDYLIKVIPIVLIFVLGYALKRIRLFSSANADLFLKFVFYVSMPALVFRSITQVQLSVQYFFLPLIAVTVFFSAYFIALLVGKKLHLSSRTLGTFILGTMIMNTSFAIPFIQAAFGNEGISAVAVFDLGNALFVMTFGYFIAMKYGKKEQAEIEYKKLFLLPPIWGLIVGIIFNLVELPVNISADIFLQHLGNLTIPLVMFSIGIYFSPGFNNISRILSVIFLRSGIGLLLGFLFVSIFHLQGIIKTVVIICCGSPVGYNTLIFSSLENLDKELAANLVSISILTALMYVPILIVIIQ